MRLLKTLHEQEKFSEVEQSVIKFMLDNPKEIVNMSIRELASRTYTSTATIFRICRKCGFNGYTEFKIKFVSEESRTIDMDNHRPEKLIIDFERPIGRQDDIRSVVKKMAFLEIESIEETKNEINYEQLERVAKLIDKAKQVVFFGYDLNYYIAQSTVYYFLQINKMALIHDAMSSQMNRAISLDKDDIAIIISRSGENKKLIQTARILQQKGIKVILLTSNKETSLVKLCDEFIYVANTVEFLNMGGIVFSVGCRYILDVLFGILISYNMDNAEKMVKVYEQLVGNHKDDNRIW